MIAALVAGAREADAAEAAVACPAAAASIFADNGADGLLARRPGSGAPLRLLAIGSSSTLGVGASAPAHAYPAQLASDLASQWGMAAEIRNAGVAGETISATLARLRGELASGRLDLVIWQVGTNDAVAGADVAAFRADLEAGVALARGRRVPMILVDPQFYFGIKDIARYERYVAVIADVGARMHVPVFSRFAMMQTWGAKSATSLTEALSADGFHMDDQGYACFAKALAGDIAEESKPVEKAAAKM